MEKRLFSPLSGGKHHQLLDLAHRAPPFNQDRLPETGVKLSREDVSRCIGIWAKFYRYDKDEPDAGDLCLPARPWMDRNGD